MGEYARSIGHGDLFVPGTTFRVDRPLPSTPWSSSTFWPQIALCALILSIASGSALGQCGRFRFPDLPRVLQATVSNAWGHDMPAYEAWSEGPNILVANGKQHLDAIFGAKGVSISDGEQTFALVLSAYGYNGSLRAARPVAPRASFNRVEYRRSGLTEWYANGPMGLEQGFTVERPPAGKNGQPLTIALRISGDYVAALSGDGQSAKLKSRNDRHELNYAGLSATDASGRDLRAWIELQQSSLLIKVEDAGARYPIVVDPWFQMAKVVASDRVSSYELGVAVAMSGDVLVAGAPISDSFGSVYVFVKPKNGWAHVSQTAVLTPTGTGNDDVVGASVAISGDTVVAGSPQNAYGNKDAGAAYVFVKPAGGWKDTTDVARLTSSEAGAAFGASVAIEGDTIVVGHPDQYPATTPGAVDVFVKPVQGWKHATETARLLAADGLVGDSLGCSASISGDAVASGAPGNGTHNGKAYVFVKPPSGWMNMTQTAELTPSDGQSSDQFGDGVAIHGNTSVIGAPFNSTQGAAYVFVKPPGGWQNATESAKLTSSDPGTSWLGFSVALDDKHIVLGAPYYSHRQNDREGAAFVYTKPKDGWKTTSKFDDKLTGSDARLINFFGTSVAISPTAVVAGAPWAHVGFNVPGAAYIFGQP